MRGNQPLRIDLADQRPQGDRPLEPGGDLGVPADHGYPGSLAGSRELPGQLIDQGGRRFPFREEEGGHQPARPGPSRGDIVNVDLEQVPADCVGGKGDRVGFYHPKAVAHLDHRAVKADPRAQADLRIVGGQPAKHALQQLWGQFAVGENLNRRVSHGSS